MKARRTLSTVLPATLVLLAILACGGPATEEPEFPNGEERETSPEPDNGEEEEEPPEEEPQEEELPPLLGSVAPDEDVVNHANARDSLTQLRELTDLRDEDRLEILRGGVASIVLDIGWEFFVFNTTRLGVELAEGDTVEQTLLMENGTLLGRRRLDIAEEGEPVTFPLPGNRSITVTGTEFFVVLDEDTDEVMAGNFEGTVTLEGSGDTMRLSEGTFIREWQPDQSPDDAVPGEITFTFDDFLDWGYDLDEPFDFREVVCNDDSEYVRDVTLPDGSEAEPGEQLTKVWEVLNDGTCTWTDGYTLVFDRGDDLSGPDQSPLEENVPPGESVEIAIDLVAPEQPGRYQGWWQLADEEGETFGQTPYVDINVVDRTPPPAPSLLSPANNYSDSLTNACPSVTLRWSEPSDLSGIAGYKVEVWRQVSGSWELDVSPSVSGTSMTYDPTLCVVDPTTYRWRVRATDRAGNSGAYSSYRNFSLYINDTFASTPVQISPAHNARFEATESCPNVTMTWSSVSDPSGIDDYELTIEMWDGNNWIFLTSRLLATSTSSSYQLPAFLCDYGVNYLRWKVRTHDNSGNVSPYSPTRWIQAVKLFQGPS